MYATASSVYNPVPYRMGKETTYFSPSYSRSSSFDGVQSNRMYGGALADVTNGSRPMPIPYSSEERPLRISGSYGESMASVFAPTTIGQGGHYSRVTSKPPLPPGHQSSYSSYKLSAYQTPSESNTRYPRSVSVDRSPLSYHPAESKSRLWEEELRAQVPGQVYNIATRFERLNRPRADNSPRPYRAHVSHVSVNGYGNEDSECPGTLTVNGCSYGSVGKRSLGRQRRSSGSSEDSNSESRDALSALPPTGHRLYRSPAGATSMPDVPSFADYSGAPSSASTKKPVDNQNRHATARTRSEFNRGDATRNSGSSLESTDSSHSSTNSSGAGASVRERKRMEAGCSYDANSFFENNTGKAGLLGLQNIGNTCFMNSVLQCLSHTKPLREYCLKGWLSDINNNNSRMKGALMKAFSDLLSQLWSTSRATYIIPDHFKSQIQKFAPRFVGYSQQDAQEFLRYVLQGLHEDVNRVKGKSVPLPPVDDSLPDPQKAAESWKRYLRVDDSKIVDLFVGQLKSELKCTSCGYVSTTFDPFWDLSLPIPQYARYNDVSLYDCLDAFTKEEVLDGDEKPKCDKCKTRRKCTKMFSVQRFPKILVLHLKRFSGERFRSRLSAVVEFPVKSLEMKKYASGQASILCSSYSLYAVSNHSGTPLMGHYTALCKHALSGKWHLYDDSRVTGVDSNRAVFGSEAYVLFYELTDGNN